jgi:DNA-binding transcriptional regulator YdaS (Cro superfamily)
MELIGGRKQKEIRKAVQVKYYVSDLDVTNKRPQNSTELSGNGKGGDTELTNQITQKQVCRGEEVRKCVNNMELRSEMTRKEMSYPVDISTHGDVSVMELTSGMKWKEIHNADEVNRYINVKELPNERPQKEISIPTGLSSLTHSATRMKLTHAMNWKEAHKAAEMNRNVSDMALTSERPQREIFNPLDASNHNNVSDMELTSGVQWKKTHNTVEMNRNVSDMALTSEGPQREIFNPMDMSNHANVSDMELTSGIK